LLVVLPTSMEFADELKAWRGNRLQKQVCDIFGVALVTYQKWEQGVNLPHDLAREQVRWRMAADSSGIPIEQYRLAYLTVIQRVAAEIQKRK